MFKKRKRKEITSIEEIHVNLKKVGNIRPGVYLTFIYALILIVILFLAFLLPGLNNPGAVVAFTVLPQGSAVYIDDLYAGTSPCTQYVPAGAHRVSIRKKGYLPFTEDVDVEKRIFASLIFPKKQSVTARLELESMEAVLSDAFTKYAGWSSIDAFHSRYQPERIVSDTIKDIYYGGNALSAESLDELLISLMPYSVDEPLLADFILGFTLHETAGNALSPSSYLQALSDLLSIQKSFPSLPFWLAGQLNGEKSELISGTEWYTGSRDSYTDKIEKAASAAPQSGAEDLQKVSLGNIDFIFIPSESRLLGNGTADSFPLFYTPEPFYISAREISYRDYGEFIAAEPDFAPGNGEELLAEGLVTEEYLKDWDLNKNTDLPVAYISSYAAEAYCRWLNGKLPDYVRSDFQVALPNEYQWECAASYSDLDHVVLFSRGKDGPKPVNRNSDVQLSDFVGNVWEWCGNWYAPADFILFNDQGKRADTPSYLTAVERPVRGGSWAVMDDLISLSSRGSQPPEWCTPFLGFRPAIVPK